MSPALESLTTESLFKVDVDEIAAYLRIEMLPRQPNSDDMTTMTSTFQESNGFKLPSDLESLATDTLFEVDNNKMEEYLQRERSSHSKNNDCMTPTPPPSQDYGQLSSEFRQIFDDIPFLSPTMDELNSPTDYWKRQRCCFDDILESVPTHQHYKPTPILELYSKGDSILHPKVNKNNQELVDHLIPDVPQPSMTDNLCNVHKNLETSTTSNFQIPYSNSSMTSCLTFDPNLVIRERSQINHKSQATQNYTKSENMQLLKQNLYSSQLLQHQATQKYTKYESMQLQTKQNLYNSQLLQLQATQNHTMSETMQFFKQKIYSSQLLQHQTTQNHTKSESMQLQATQNLYNSQLLQHQATQNCAKSNIQLQPTSNFPNSQLVQAQASEKYAKSLKRKRQTTQNVPNSQFQPQATQNRPKFRTMQFQATQKFPNSQLVQSQVPRDRVESEDVQIQSTQNASNSHFLQSQATQNCAKFRTMQFQATNINPLVHITQNHQDQSNRMTTNPQIATTSGVQKIMSGRIRITSRYVNRLTENGDIVSQRRQTKHPKKFIRL